MGKLSISISSRAASFALAAFAAFGVAGCPSGKPAATLSTNESWCPDGFEVGPQDTCFAVPETTTRDTPVLVYLHGMYKGHGSPAEWALVRSAVARGFAVVVPRGKRGLCAWKAEVSDHFCWPQDVDDPHVFSAAVAEWDRVLWQVDAIMDGGPHKRYVLGFSNGGYFATYLLSHALFPAQAYAIVNAGPLGPIDKPAKSPPVMLLAAQGDTVQGPMMRDLHDRFGKVGWPHAYCTRPGDHALMAEDMNAALMFFKHDADGTLKPGATSYACEGGTAPGDPAAPSAPASAKK